MPRFPGASLIKESEELEELWGEEGGREDALVCRTHDEKVARRRRRRKALDEASSKWYWLNSVELQHGMAVLILVLETGMISAGLLSSKVKTVTFIGERVINHFAKTVYPKLESMELPEFTEDMLGKFKFWTAKFTLELLFLMAGSGLNPAACATLVLFYICLCVSLFLLVTPWPIEGYELNAAKAMRLQQARQAKSGESLSFEFVWACLQLLAVAVVEPQNEKLQVLLLVWLSLSCAETSELVATNDIGPMLDVLTGAGSMAFLSFHGMVFLAVLVFDVYLFRLFRQPYAFLDHSRLQWWTSAVLQSMVALEMFLFLMGTVAVVAYFSFIYREQLDATLRPLVDSFLQLQAETRRWIHHARSLTARSR